MDAAPATTPAGPIRLFLIGDAAFQKDLAYAVSLVAGAELAGIARDREQGLVKAAKAAPDIVVVDAEMAGISDRREWDAFRARFPDICVIIVSNHDEIARLSQAGIREDGATAFLSRESSSANRAYRKELAAGLEGLLGKYAVKRTGVFVGADSRGRDVRPCARPARPAGSTS